LARMAVVFSFLMAALVLRVLLLPRIRGVALDQPNERSLHSRPVPRVGGLALMCGAGFGIILAGGLAFVMVLAFTLMALSLLDDWRGLHPGVRFATHLAAAVAFVMTALPTQFWPVVIALVLAITWMTNLYNFMDGADGLAGGMAVFGFGTYALAAWLSGDAPLAMACLCIVAAATGFLLFNFPPAKVFMGDAGSVPLGFLAAAIGLLGWQRQLWPVWFTAIVFAPFVIDASVTLMKRLLRGERVWHAHRSHYYQRQVLMGWSHGRLALAEYALMGVSGAVAVLASRATPLQASVLIATLFGIYIAAMILVDQRWARRRRSDD
jgi:UDP-GlcNAc:undecaprenyl-phosphate GlcNAc-1-phosphate transferase